MPRSVTKWYCGKCEKEFNNRIEAKDCEDEHYRVIKIINRIYSPECKAPKKLQVEIELGPGGDRKDVFYQLVREGWGAN